MIYYKMTVSRKFGNTLFTPKRARALGKFLVNTVNCRL